MASACIGVFSGVVTLISDMSRPAHDDRKKHKYIIIRGIFTLKRPLSEKFHNIAIIDNFTRKHNKNIVTA